MSRLTRLTEQDGLQHLNQRRVKFREVDHVRSGEEEADRQPVQLGDLQGVCDCKIMAMNYMAVWRVSSIGLPKNFFNSAFYRTVSVCY